MDKMWEQGIHHFGVVGRTWWCLLLFKIYRTFHWLFLFLGFYVEKHYKHPKQAATKMRTAAVVAIGKQWRYLKVHQQCLVK